MYIPSCWGRCALSDWFGAVLGLLRAVLGYRGAVLGPPWVVEPSWAALGPSGGAGNEVWANPWAPGGLRDLYFTTIYVNLRCCV